MRRAEQKRLVEVILAELPQYAAMLIRWIDLDGLTQEEVAERLARPLKSSGSNRTAIEALQNSENHVLPIQLHGPARVCDRRRYAGPNPEDTAHAGLAGGGLSLGAIL